MYADITRIMLEQNIGFEKALKVYHAEQAIEKKRACLKLKGLDREFDTPKNSPLHHDNRCGAHNHVKLNT